MLESRPVKGQVQRALLKELIVSLFVYIKAYSWFLVDYWSRTALQKHSNNCKFYWYTRENARKRTQIGDWVYHRDVAPYIYWIITKVSHLRSLELHQQDTNYVIKKTLKMISYLFSREKIENFVWKCLKTFFGKDSRPNHPICFVFVLRSWIRFLYNEYTRDLPYLNKEH